MTSPTVQRSAVELAPSTAAVAGAVAARQLRASGHTVSRDGGRLVVAGPGGPVESTVSWAGPVRLPLHDEHTVQAACGLMHVHGRRNGSPTLLPADVASTVAGLLLSQGTLAALLAGARGRPIHRVSTSVAEAALLLCGQYLAAATAGDDPQVSAADEPRDGAPPFISSDGVRFEIETLDAEPWRRFWDGLGAHASAVRRGWPAFQQRFATALCALPAGLDAAAASHPFARIERMGCETAVTVVAMRSTHVPPCDLPPWALTDLPGAAALPALTGRLPLAGIRVVDAGRRVQGPLAGHLLAMLGADVIHMEPPGGDPLRGVPPMAGGCSARFLALNRHKRPEYANLSTATGRRYVRELVADADVFLHNWAPGRAERFGLDAGTLAQVRPGLVYAHASDWGPGFGRRWIGTDYVVQAYSGIGALFGRPSLVTVVDVLGGLVCAEGVLSALLRRATDGRGRRVDSSLLSSALVLLAASKENGRPRVTTAEGTVPVTTDLAALAADLRFAPALEQAGCTMPAAPWRFES